MLLASGCTQRGEVLTPLTDEPHDSGSIDPDAAASPAATPTPAGLSLVRISTGNQHSCALIDGAAYCWGNNGSGRLGLGDTAERTVPTRIETDTQWTEIHAAANHTCALDEQGQVYCWGQNNRGQLGTGDRDSRNEPTEVALPGRATLLASAFYHSCAILSDRALYCWGKNSEGELGQDDAVPSATNGADGLSPLPVGTAGWATVSVGDGHTCAIRVDGSLWCWGRNSEFELGFDGAIQLRRPTRVGSDTDWSFTRSGQHHTCALREDQSLWCWGQNSGSASGAGAPLGIEPADLIDAPTRVGNASNWTSLDTNTFHTCAINRSNELWCWGRNAEGQLGLGDIDLRSTPELVGTAFVSVSTGRFSTCALRGDQTPVCTGENADSQLGTGDQERRDVFSEVEWER